MLTATECRKLAKVYRDQAGEGDISQKRSSILKNVANSLTALGSQLEILDACLQEEQSRRG